MRRCASPAPPSRRSAAACSSCALAPPESPAALMKLRSGPGGSGGSRKAWPPAAVTVRPTAACIARSKANARVSRGSVVGVVGIPADALDDDLVGLDRHLDLPVPGPVLGVDRVVGDGGVEPEPVALVAVLERRLVGRGPLAGATPATAAAAAAPGPLLVLLGGLFLLLAGLGLAGGLGLQLGGDEGVVLGAEVDLVVEVDPGRL